MTKTYPEQLGEWVKKRESTKRDKNLVAFLAVRDDVQSAIDSGYALKTIWSHLYDERRVQFGYDTFLNHVGRYIQRPGKAAPAAAPTAALTTPATPAATARPPRRKANQSDPGAKGADRIPGFVFNASPKKEDLI